MVLIPAMIRVAPYIGMIDKPDPRKVHTKPIPRAGGMGIVLGALTPMLIILPLTDFLLSYYLGALVLLVFGLWDDIAELGHYVKFIGQFIAACLVVYFGGLSVETFPFMDDELLPPSIGQPFTVIALVGMINAINHSDGLDGLAGGESLISLAGILFLASQASGFMTMVMSVAVMGGVFGFLRFNSHPARVFMGDGGSQFLGFALGVLAILLTQRDNTTLSPALPLLLLGLPIADILVVFWKRMRAGGSWFKATKNHIHHRLLELNFHHYESVTIIYTIQAALVFIAVSTPYATDISLIIVYLGVCALLFSFLRGAEARGWRAHTAGVPNPFVVFVERCRENPTLELLPRRIVAAGVSIFLLAAAVAVDSVPIDLAFIASLLVAALFVRLLWGYKVWFLMLRLLVFMAIALLVYLAGRYQVGGILAAPVVNYVFFGILGMALVVGVRLAKQDNFNVTPLDYLVVLIVLLIMLLPEITLNDADLVEMALKSIILFYAAELAMRQMKSRWNLFTSSVLASLAIVAVRGIAP